MHSCHGSPTYRFCENRVGRVTVTTITASMVDAAFRKTAAQPTPPAAQMFSKGDFVVYPTHGVGRIDRVGPESVAGHRLNVIRISFADSQMTLRIPVVKACSAGLRKLGTAEALAEALTTLQGRPRSSRLMWAKRAQEYQAKINSGDLRALAEVVRDLQSAPDGSGASFSQKNLFGMAIDRLAAEFAAVSNVNKSAAVDRLSAALGQTPEPGSQEHATQLAKTHASAI
jgi:CarD family transcriptional regulator